MEHDACIVHEHIELGKSDFHTRRERSHCAGSATSLWIVWSFGASSLPRPVLTRADRSHYLVTKFDEFEREARPMPAEPPVIRMVRPLRIIKFLSGDSFEVKSKTWCVSN